MSCRRISAEVDVDTAHCAGCQRGTSADQFLPDFTQSGLDPACLAFGVDRTEEEGEILMIVDHIVAFHDREVSVGNRSRFPAYLNACWTQFAEILQRGWRENKRFSGELDHYCEKQQCCNQL